MAYFKHLSNCRYCRQKAQINFDNESDNGNLFFIVEVTYGK